MWLVPFGAEQNSIALQALKNKTTFQFKKEEDLRGKVTCLGENEIIFLLVFAIYNELSCVLFNRSIEAEDKSGVRVDRGNEKGIRAPCPHLIEWGPCGVKTLLSHTGQAGNNSD